MASKLPCSETYSEANTLRSHVGQLLVHINRVVANISTSRSSSRANKRGIVAAGCSHAQVFMLQACDSRAEEKTHRAQAAFSSWQGNTWQQYKKQCVKVPFAAARGILSSRENTLRLRLQRPSTAAPHFLDKCKAVLARCVITAALSFPV